VRGGSYRSNESYLGCGEDQDYARGAYWSEIGFRCCADP
jgi:formylglycine-generating enzyme required for sulfatase activity